MRCQHPDPDFSHPYCSHCSSTDTHRSTDSNHHLSTADLTVIQQIHQHTAQLSTYLSQDLLTQTHHQNACISFIICTCFESSNRFLQHKNDNSNRSGSSCPSPTSSTLLQHEPSYLSDVVENPRHSRSYELQSSSLLKSFYLSPKSSRSLRTQPTQLSEIYLFYLSPILYCLFYLLPRPQKLSSPQQTSDLSPQKVRCFFQKLLQNVQFRSNPIQDPPSCHLNWTYFINAGRRHLHPCTQLKRKPCNLHAILMGAVTLSQLMQSYSEP